MNKTAQELLDFTATCTSPYHTVLTSEKFLVAAGFHKLAMNNKWTLVPGEKYYVKVFDSALVAFRVGKQDTRSIKIAAAHTDFPCFRIKPNPEINTEGYGTLNVEAYGGMIVSTWMDRPLSLAGKVALKTKDPFKPEVKLVDFQRPLLTMSSLAIHMNREVNDGYKWSKQKDVLPLAEMLGQDSKDKKFFSKFLAKELNCKAGDILSFELSAYPVETGCFFGLKDEFLSAGRLDNITSVKACLDGIVASKATKGIQIAALFDNEEVGSRTKQGADSNVMMQILERIYAVNGHSSEELLADIAAGFMLSVDVGHALHPNYKDKCDPTNKPVLNGGFLIKQAASQAYAGDADAVAVVVGLCKANKVPYQMFVNNGDIKGGSTLGSMESALLSMRTMDVGVPLLAMHSCRETMGAKDEDALKGLLCAFFK